MLTKARAIQENRFIWKFKECPRCEGDLSYDSYTNDWTCLQCGHVREDERRNRTIIKENLVKL